MGQQGPQTYRLKKLPRIPPSRFSPLIRSGQTAISDCSVILHCRKYHIYQVFLVMIARHLPHWLHLAHSGSQSGHSIHFITIVMRARLNP